MIVFKVTPERIRQIGSRGNIEHMTTVEADAFLIIYEKKLEAALSETLIRFVNGKL